MGSNPTLFFLLNVMIPVRSGKFNPLAMPFCNLQSHRLQATSLHKDCHSAGEPYDVDQLVVKYYCSCVNCGSSLQRT